MQGQSGGKEYHSQFQGCDTINKEAGIWKLAGKIAMQIADLHI